MSGSTFVFYGRVLPERADVNVGEPVRVHIKSIGALCISILRSEIVAELQMEECCDFNLHTAKNFVESMVRMITDSLGFTIVCGYDVEITGSFDLRTKNLTVFGVQEFIFSEEENKEIKNGKPLNFCIETNGLINACARCVEVRIALGDFREALRNPDFTAFHCFRSIEALRHFFPGNEAKQWLSLAEVVNRSSDEIGELKSVASKQRHGRVLPQTWEQRRSQLIVTWHIINDFSKYVARKTYHD